jgi:GNAT superfamily N-acetyltransferase
VEARYTAIRAASRMAAGALQHDVPSSVPTSSGTAVWALDMVALLRVRRVRPTRELFVASRRWGIIYCRVWTDGCADGVRYSAAKERTQAVPVVRGAWPMWCCSHVLHARRARSGLSVRSISCRADLWAVAGRAAEQYAARDSRRRPRVSADVEAMNVAAMPTPYIVRSIRAEDYDDWRPLWDGYNAFYGRQGPTSLPEATTKVTWERFFNPQEPVHALVAVESDKVVGLAHFLFHRSTTRLNDVCYLQDLFTAEHLRGQGIGKRLILAVYEAARSARCNRVYWQTQVTNTPGRVLYDKVAQHSGFIVYTHEL